MSALRGLVTERPRLAGALLLVAAALVAGTVAMPRLTGDEPPAVVEDPTEPLRQAYVAPLGLALLYPQDWKVRTEGQTLRLTSPERSVTATFAAPAPSGHTQDVRRMLEQAVSRTLDDDKVLRRGRGRLGTDAVRTVELRGRLRPGRRVRVLLMAGATDWRTYGVTVTTALRPSKRRVAELAGILASVELSAPKKVRAKPTGRS